MQNAQMACCNWNVTNSKKDLGNKDHELKLVLFKKTKIMQRLANRVTQYVFTPKSIIFILFSGSLWSVNNSSFTFGLQIRLFFTKFFQIIDNTGIECYNYTNIFCRLYVQIQQLNKACFQGKNMLKFLGFNLLETGKQKA